VLSVVLSERRCIVGRSGSSAGVLPLLFVDDVEVLEVSPVLEVLSEWRFMVGRSGSSDCEVPLPVLEAVVVVELSPVGVVLSERRFMVGRSGSPVCVLPLPFEEAVSVVVVPDEVVPVDGVVVLLESPEDPDRRFIEGRSESSVEDVVVVVDVVGAVAGVGVDLLWSLPVAGVLVLEVLF
jgi:hypothetical protein